MQYIIQVIYRECLCQRASGSRNAGKTPSPFFSLWDLALWATWAKGQQRSGLETRDKRVSQIARVSSTDVSRFSMTVNNMENQNRRQNFRLSFISKPSAWLDFLITQLICF